MYKKQSENQLTSSVDDLFSRNELMPVARKTANLSNHLSMLRDARKSELLPDDENREEILFGSVEVPDQDVSGYRMQSRNQPVYRNTYNYKQEIVEDIEDIPDDVEDSPVEENFDININEHDEEILLKSVRVNHKDQPVVNNPPSSYFLSKPFLHPENTLEVIKESDDVTLSPIVHNNLKFGSGLEMAKKASDHKENVNVPEEEELHRNPNKSIKSRIARRNTVALKPPSKLSGLPTEPKKVIKPVTRPSGLKKPIEPLLAPSEAKKKKITKSFIQTPSAKLKQPVTKPAFAPKTNSELKVGRLAKKPPQSALKSPDFSKSIRTQEKEALAKEQKEIEIRRKMENEK